MEDGSSDAFWKLLAAVFLVLLNGFFVAAEFAIVKVRATRIDEMVQQGSWPARVAKKAVQHLDAYLSATQLGITIASLGLGWIGEPAIADLIEPYFRDLGRWSPAATHTTAITVAFILITFMHIVFGELAPKSLAILRAESTTLWVVYPLDIFYRLFYPAIWLLNGAANLVLRLIGLQVAGEHEEAHSEEEIRMILAASHAGGYLKDSELDIVRNVFEFARKQAKDIMVPRVDIVYLSTEWPPEKNRRIALQTGYTRFPLCEGDIDQVIGMVHIKDILSLEPDARLDIRRLKRDILIIPENKPIDQLLREFQHSHTYMALVMDEYGGTAGLVSLEDVLEELVGEIEGEFGAEPKKIVPTQDGGYLLDSRLTLMELKRDLGIALHEEEADTIGGYVMAALGAIPHPGDQVEADGYRLTVVQMAGRRIRRVMLIPLHRAESRQEF